MIIHLNGTLLVLQGRNPRIKAMAQRLESEEDQQYELRNGLVYKKHGSNLLFLVPEQMEGHVLFRYHNEMGHVGSSKIIELLGARTGSLEFAKSARSMCDAF